MPAYSGCFTWVLLGGTMGAPSVPGRRAGCSLRGGPTRISLAPVLAPRPVERRRSHAGPHETSERGGRPTGTEGSRGSLTPTTPCRRLLQGGWTNERSATDRKSSEWALGQVGGPGLLDRGVRGRRAAGRQAQQRPAERQLGLAAPQRRVDPGGGAGQAVRAQRRVPGPGGLRAC